MKRHGLAFVLCWMALSACSLKSHLARDRDAEVAGDGSVNSDASNEDAFVAMDAAVPADAAEDSAVDAASEDMSFHCGIAGEPCAIPGSCQMGVVAPSCECVPDADGDFLDPGTRCVTGAPNRYCTTGGVCAPCDETALTCPANTGIRGCVNTTVTCALPTFDGTPQCVDEPVFRPRGSICIISSGVEGLCSGASPVCEGCTAGTDCIPTESTDRPCALGRTVCDGSGELVCETASSTDYLESGSAGVSCETTETCNGVEGECQSVMSNVASVAVGPNHSCVIAADSAAALSRGETFAACWGSNFRAALGAGVVTSCNVGRAARVDLCNDDTLVPGTLCRASVSSPKEIVVGHSTSCLIDSEGAVFCWGNNLNSEVGGPSGTLDGDGIAYRACSGTPGASPRQDRACFEPAARRVRLPEGTRVVKVVISHDAPVNCTAGYSNSTVCDPTGPEWRRVCAVTDDGKLYCWGGVAASGPSEITMGVMRPSMSASPEFYDATADWRFEKVAMGSGQWCTLVRDRSTTSATRGQTRVLCAGEFANGERGDGLSVADRGSEVPAFPPAANTVRAVLGLTDAVDLSVSSGFACAVRAAGASTGGQGRVVCWGRLAANSMTASENGGAEDARKPVYVRATSGAALRYIDASGALPTPESGELITGATSVASGPQTSCVRLSAGRMRCWGTSNLGIGTVSTSTVGVLQPSQPTREVNPGTSLSSSSLATTTSMAIAFHTDDVSPRDGTVGCFIRDYSRRQLFCWGTNATRQLGHCISGVDDTRVTPMPVLPFDASMNGVCRAGDSFVAPSTCVQSDP